MTHGSDDIDAEWAEACRNYYSKEENRMSNYEWDDQLKKFVSKTPSGAIPATTYHTGYQGGVTKYATACKHPPKHVTTTRNKKIAFYGATGSEIPEAYTYNYAFDLNRSFRDKTGAISEFKRVWTPKAKPQLIVNAPPEFKAADDVVEFDPGEDVSVGTKFIDMAWPDMSIPSMYSRKNWDIIANAIADDSEVLVACTGGHGRTGTFLAIVVGIIEGVANGDVAINFIREAYCKHAIETRSQEDYICKILGK